MLCIFKVHYQTLETCNHTLERKKINYNRVLCRPSPTLHLAGGVLLGRAYRGCNVEVCVRGVREPPTQVDVRVNSGRKRARRHRRRRWCSGRRRCRRRRARGRGMSCARAPREREGAPGVAIMLGLPRIWPVRGEPRARQRWRGRGMETGMGF